MCVVADVLTFLFFIYGFGWVFVVSWVVSTLFVSEVESSSWEALEVGAGLMSWLPIYNSWVVFAGILSFFLWKVWGVLFFVCILAVSVVFLLSEVLKMGLRYPLAFWLFISSEVMAFGSLFAVCLWFSDGILLSISDFMELPLLGSFLLLSSSLTVTTYHHFVGLRIAPVFLIMTIFLGICFILMQVWEFSDCECDLLYSVYDAVSFCTVGLHFSHVLGGLIGLSVVLGLGINRIGGFYVDLAVWYWHFVDYIWLLVFLLIYVV